MTRVSDKMLVSLQAFAAIASLTMLAMWPPASGEMMLVPLGGGGANDMAKTALAAGAALLGPGPLPGSMVVVGDRSVLAKDIGFDGIVMAAPPAGCGNASASARGIAA